MNYQSHRNNLQRQWNSSQIRPILEYCSTIWSPSDVANIDLVEGIQRRIAYHMFILVKADQATYVGQSYLNRKVWTGRAFQDLSLRYKIALRDSDLFKLDESQNISST